MKDIKNSIEVELDDSEFIEISNKKTNEEDENEEKEEVEVEIIKQNEEDDEFESKNENIEIKEEGEEEEKLEDEEESNEATELLKSTTNSTTTTTKITKQPQTNRKSINNEVSVFKIILVISFYFVISISTVFLNKFIFGASSYKFPYPLTVTWFQLTISLLCVILIYPLNNNKNLGGLLSFLPDLEFDINIAKQIWPFTLVYVLMLSFNNYTLAYVNVVFYQIARSLSIIFSVIFSFFILDMKTSKKSIMGCLIVFIGYAIGALGGIKINQNELSESQNENQGFFSGENLKIILGLIFGFFSSVFVALYSVLGKKYLKNVQNNHWVLLIYNTTLAIIFIFPLVLILEIKNVFQCDFLLKIGFWVPMIITALLGFLINIAFFLQINYTTPLTNTISGTAKACVQTVLSYFVFNTDLSLMSAIGVTLCIGGSGGYSLIKYQENKKKKLKKKTKLPK